MDNLTSGAEPEATTMPAGGEASAVSDPVATAAAMIAIGRQVAAALDDETLAVDHGELLYGADGLPR